MIVSKDGRVWIRRGIPRVVFSFPSRDRGINNRTRERERESSNYTAAGVILSRLRWASINFRKHVSMHVDRHFFFLLFNYRPANEIYIYILGSLYFSLLDFFFGFSNFNIYIKDWFEFLRPVGVIASNYVSYVALYLLLPKLTHEGLTKMADPDVNWNIIKRYCF